MTDTIARGAANQAGAKVNKDAYAEAKDFLPLNGIDHVEFWVGNARQASAYYRALWGFTPVAYAGLETGIRDRASYVMRRDDITFVLTAPLTPDGEIAEHVRRHGDGVHDIAFAVDDAASAFRETTSRGARPALDPIELEGGEDGVLRRSSVHTYGEVLHSFVDRRNYHGVFAPGYRKV
ncbi:MAG: VOC family protein, partial [Chloroflexota bacterium]